MKALTEVIEDIVGAYQYGYSGTDGSIAILRRYAESIIDRCSDSGKLQVLGTGDDMVWIHRDSIQKVKEEL